MNVRDNSRSVTLMTTTGGGWYTKGWATFVPFFTEWGRWRREEDTLLRNCEKPWILLNVAIGDCDNIMLLFFLSENETKTGTAFWKICLKLHCNSSSQIKIHTFFYIKDLFLNHVLCATYGEKYNIYIDLYIYIYLHTGSKKKKEQKRKSNLIARCYIDCFSRQ